MRAIENELRRALDVAPDSAYAEYVQSWRPQVAEIDLGEVPESLRGNAPPLDARLADTPFSFIDPIPVTNPVKRPPA